MSVGARLFAFAYDRLMRGSEQAGLAERRRKLLAGASGRVLEIGAGTGLNLLHYGDGIEALTLAEPEEPMARRLERRLREQTREAEIVRASAEALPFEDDAFDTAVSTLVLCTVDDQDRALRELRRVLRPGGKLLFLEHVRAEDAGLAKWQDRLNRFNAFIGQGCNCNRDTVSAIKAAGFAITSLERDTFPKAPPLVRPLVAGTAIPDALPA